MASCSCVNLTSCFFLLLLDSGHLSLFSASTSSCPRTPLSFAQHTHLIIMYTPLSFAFALGLVAQSGLSNAQMAKTRKPLSRDLASSATSGLDVDGSTMIQLFEWRMDLVQLLHARLLRSLFESVEVCRTRVPQSRKMVRNFPLHFVCEPSGLKSRLLVQGLLPHTNLHSKRTHQRQPVVDVLQSNVLQARQQAR